MEIDILSRAFPIKVIDRYWLSFTGGSTTCGWQNYSPALNCQHLRDLIGKIESTLDVPVSITVDRSFWTQMFKDQQGCPEVSNSLLWWNPDKRNNQTNFDGYVQIGGWNRPYLKFMSTNRLMCGMILVKNYYEERSVEE